MKRRALLLPLLALPGLALAQSAPRSATVYRCGPGGRQLSDRPCPAEGGASAVRFDQPSDADRRAARERAQAEARDAERLRKERQQLEAQSAPAPARLDAPRPPAAPASREPDRVAGPGSGKKKRKPKSS